MDKALLMAAFSKTLVATKTPAKPAPVPDGWVKTSRTKRGKPVYQVYATFARADNPVRQLVDHFKRLDLNTLALTPGMTCPRCLGAGRVQWGVCHWCNVPSTQGPGKGVLDARDIAFIEARRAGAGPICDVIAA